MLIGEIEKCEYGEEVQTIYGTHMVYFGRAEVAVYDFKGRLLRGKLPPKAHEAFSLFVKQAGEWYPPEKNIHDDPLMYWDNLELDEEEYELMLRLRFGSTDFTKEYTEGELKQVKEFFRQTEEFLNWLRRKYPDRKFSCVELMAQLGVYLSGNE